MSEIMLSVYIGFAVVIVIPVMTIIVYADYYRVSSRRQRLQLWQVAILLGTTGLAVWTYLWVEPTGETWSIAATPLWVFCGIGITISIALGLAQMRLALRQRQLDALIKRAVLQP